MWLPACRKTTLCKTMVRISNGTHHSLSQRCKIAVAVLYIREEIVVERIDILCSARLSLPNVKNSCFVYVYSTTLPLGNARVPPSSMVMVKGELQMKAELVYWMRFLASNSKPVNDSSRFPRMMFVVTNKDRLDKEQWAESILSKAVVTEASEEIKGRIVLEETVAVVNAHSCEDVESVMTEVEKSLQELLDHSKDYAVFDHVRQELRQWCAKNSDRPIVDMKTVDREKCSKVRGRAWEEAAKASGHSDD